MTVLTAVLVAMAIPIVIVALAIVIAIFFCEKNTGRDNHNMRFLGWWKNTGRDKNKQQQIFSNTSSIVRWLGW